MVGEYEDGRPGEIFMNISKQGSTLAGIMDALAISVSHGLQYGVPLRSYVKAFINMSFAPSGMTDDDEIKTVSSLVDYIFRRLAKEYLTFEEQLELGLASLDDYEISELQETLPIEDEPSDIHITKEPEEKVERPAIQEPKMTFESNLRKTNGPVNDESAPICS